MIRWNWQQPDWPEFTYDLHKMKALEEEFLLQSGVFLGAWLHISEDDKQHLSIELMSDEALKTSAIEGEVLNRESVQSSIQRKLGLAVMRTPSNPAEAGVAEMMVQLYRHYQQPLTQKLFFEWHRMIMNGRRDLDNIGAWRTSAEPMQIVSGRLYEPKIHFEAPPAKRISKEMARFIKWFNATAPEGKAPLPALTRAAIAHLYFESIHPFEDGNGRIGRAIAEKALAQALRKPALISLSSTIHAKRKHYYAMLEQSNKSNQIDAWLAYFAKTILDAQQTSMRQVEFIIQKTKFFDRHREQLNARQQKMIERMFREGINGFEGGLSAENYIRITKTSRATATRDLVDLVEKKAMTKHGSGKGTRYDLNLNIS